MEATLKLRVTVNLPPEIYFKTIGHAKKRNEKIEDTVKYIISKYFELRDDDIWD